MIIDNWSNIYYIIYCIFYSSLDIYYGKYGVDKKIKPYIYDRDLYYYNMKMMIYWFGYIEMILKFIIKISILYYMKCENITYYINDISMLLILDGDISTYMGHSF